MPTSKFSKPTDDAVFLRPGMTLRCLMACCLWMSGHRLGTLSAGQPPEPEPGAVRLTNGLIFRGMCSTVTGYTDVESADQGLELRMIDQGYRRIYSSTRRSEPTVVNPGDWPAVDFAIPQRRTGRKPVPQVMGVPSISPFDAEGRATIKLRLSQDRVEEIQVGITRINELFAEVTGLTHNWTYAVSVKSLPAALLSPGLLEKVPKYSTDPFVRLELSRMLIKCGLMMQAESMLRSIAADFPDAGAQLPQLNNDFRSELGRQILQELEMWRDAGQYQLVLNSGRIFPRTELAPEVQLRTRQLVDSIEERIRRTAAIQVRLRSIQAGIQEAEQKRMAAEMIPVISDGIDGDSVDRFAAFELLAQGDDMAADAQLALAASGWLLGADETIQNLKETYGLFEARQLVLDYLRTEPLERDVRAELIKRISSLEGVSVDRLSAMIQHLPAVMPVGLQRAAETAPGQFRIEGDDNMLGCLGRVPPEYHDSRSYPLIIAFPREGMPADVMLEWWGGQASRHGCIVVVPEAYRDDVGAYDASADQHRRFLTLLRRLKLGLRVDDDRVFAVGHGIGGEAAMDMATAHSEVFAGIVSVAGLGRRHLQWTSQNAAEMPWYIVVGGRQGLWFERLHLLLNKLFRRGGESRSIADVVLVKYPERGFETFFEESAALFEWMQKQRRTMLPEQLNPQILRSTDLRWSWLELQSLPSQFALLDRPSGWNDGPFQPAVVEARLTRNNGIIISRSPQTAITLKLSRSMPGIDLQKPIAVSAGRERRTVNYSPQISDLLDELWQTGERKRLCLMKVMLPSR